MCIFLHKFCYLGCNSFKNQHLNWCLFCLQIHESLILKKDVTRVQFGTLKQQFNKLINGKSQTNRHQKSD